jgi:hypothetical protein
MAKKIKFATPRPTNAPGRDEPRDAFIERMGAHGNVDALDKMNESIANGSTYEEYRARCNP